MAGRVNGPGREIDLVVLRRVGWAVFWLLACAAMTAWALGVTAPWR